MPSSQHGKATMIYRTGSISPTGAPINPLRPTKQSAQILYPLASTSQAHHHASRAATARKMSLPHQTPEGKARSFQGMLRQRDVEFNKLQNQNFDLKLKIHHLEKSLHDRAETKRLSATPDPDNFYNFDNDDTRSSISTHTNAAAFTDNHPVIVALREQLAMLREEKDTVVDELHRATDDLAAAQARADMLDKEVYEASTSCKFEAEQKEELACQLDDAQSESMLFKMELDQLREDTKTTARHVKSIQEELQVTKQKLGASQIRAEGLQLQCNAMGDAMKEERREAALLSEKMAQSALAAQSQANLAAKRLETAASAREERDAAVQKADELSTLLQRALSERDAARKGLEKERTRVDLLMRSEQEVRKGERLFSRDTGALDDMLDQLRQNGAAFSGEQPYRPQWREEALGHMNQCLHVLYRTQLEVEVKRREFVDQYCPGALIGPDAPKSTKRIVTAKTAIPS